MQNASDTKSIIVYLFAFQCLHWVSFTRCNFASVSTRHTWEVLSVWKKCSPIRLGDYDFSMMSIVLLDSLTRLGIKTLNALYELIFFFAPHAAPILFHKKEQQSDHLCFFEPLTKRTSGTKKWLNPDGKTYHLYNHAL